MKITFFTYNDWEKEYIESGKAGPNEGLDFTFVSGELTSENVPKEAEEAEAVSVFVGSKIDKGVLDKMPNLKYVATRSTGFDHIDIEECQKRAIAVSNVPVYGDNTVAEYAMALLVNLMRRVSEGYDRLRQDGQFNPRGLEGVDLEGKTLGVVGTGNIGKCAIRIAKGFDMKVVANDPYPDEEYAKKMEYEYKSLDEVLEESDAVTLHVPYCEDTHHLINEKTIKKMKDGAYLVNTSRGAVIDTEALVTALQNGKLAGAGLDVLEEEGEIKDELQFFADHQGKDYNVKTALVNYILIDMPNVIVTPHNAFNSREALERIIKTTFENLKSFSIGEAQNIVTQK